MKTQSWTLGAKINAGLTVLFACLMAIGSLSIYTLGKMSDALDDALRVESRKVELVGEIKTSIAQMLAAQRGVLLRSITRDEELQKAYQNKFDEAAQLLTASSDELAKLLVLEENRRQLASIGKGMADWKAGLPAFAKLLREQKFDDAQNMQAVTFRPIYQSISDTAEEIFKNQRVLMATLTETSVSNARINRWLNGGLLAFSLLVSFIVFLVVRKSNQSLRRLASEIGDSANQVAAAAGQVSSASQALAQGASEQAASLEETSASTEEINSMTQKNASNSRQASEETTRAGKFLKETEERLGQMIGSMNDITSSSEKISRIIKVIDEIAFQTNILALNAAVEAARAGEAGMGFAVVADEVRNLAQRCAQAAKDTSQLIEESISRSGEGKLKLDEVAESIAKVVENSAKVNVLANEVQVGSQEQARGIEQIAKAVAQMQQVTQSSAANAEEGASAGEEMSAQAESLNEAVRRLGDMVGSEEHEATSRAEAGPRKLRLPALHRAKPASPKAPQPSTPKAEAIPAGRAGFPLDEDFRDF